MPRGCSAQLRIIGADRLLESMTKDPDVRVRVSAIRALGSIKDPETAQPLIERGGVLYAAYRAKKAKHVDQPAEINEILEIATVLGRVLTATNDSKATAWLRQLGHSAPEVDVAFARIAPAAYVDETTNENPEHQPVPLEVRYRGSGLAQVES